MATTPLIAGNVYRMRVYCFAYAQLSINQWDYRVNNIIAGIPTIEDTAEYMEALVAPIYKASINAGASYRGITMVQQYPKATSSPIEENTGVGNGTVGTAATMLPTGVTGNLRKLTTTYGRGRNGMVKMPFLDSTYVLDNVLTTAAQTQYANVNNALMGGNITITEGGRSAVLVPCVYSKTAIPPIGFHYADIQGFHTNSLVGTLRKRAATGRINNAPF